MNPEIKAQWVADLRSGEFPQTTGYLEVVDNEHKPVNKTAGFCCLGVLAKQCERAGVVNRIVLPDDYVASFNNPATVSNVAMLNTPIIKWAGLRYDDNSVPVDIFMGTFDQYDLNLALTELNDSGFTFNQIADIIEYFL